MKIWQSAMMVFAVAAACGGMARADGLADYGSVDKVKPVVPLKVRAFELEQVRLLAGPFKHAEEMDKKYILALDVDRLLHTFRLNAGLPSTAKAYGGWEAPDCELRGHFAGHYLSACSMMYASTGDERFKERAEKLVAGLAEVQAKLGTSGYLSAYPETFIDRVEAKQAVWAPYYTLHKIFAGLMDTYTYCHNQQALEVCKKFGDWAIARNSKLTDEQMQGMMGNEHGGMNEALANLYALTGEEKYIKISARFNHQFVIGAAAKGIDNLDGLHANTQIPKFVGAAREYELTGSGDMKNAATFFWNTVVHERSYVIGGNSDGEAFSAKAKLSQAFGPSTTETCNTYNMLKLTRHLFAWDPKVEYADYSERALVNHILSSQNPQNGEMCYYLPLRSGSTKDYRGNESFVCCAGTGVENHAKYGDSIYFHEGVGTLYVNQFIASELSWKQAGVTVRQETQFPEEGATRLEFTVEKPTTMAVKVRHPGWATAGFEIRVNGQVVSGGTAGSYAEISRTWNTGDRVEVKMPFVVRTEGFKDNPRRMALLNGPVVLSTAAKGANGPFPNLLGDSARLVSSLKRLEGRPNAFEAEGGIFRMAGAGAANLTFEPLYLVNDHRYQVYFDELTAQEFAAQEEKIRMVAAAEAALAARSVDVVKPGQEQMERDHHVKGEGDSTGQFSDRGYRHAAKGWFSWELKVLPDQAQELAVSYWGSDVNRTFDVLVDGEKVATEKLDNKHPDAFFDQIYPLSAAMVKGKEKITVKFQAVGDSTAGGVFGVRVLRVAGAGRIP